MCKAAVYTSVMIKTFKTKGLAEFHATGRSKKINPIFANRLAARLQVLDAAVKLSECNAPGFDFHNLEGARYSMHVNGPWCVTFDWLDGDAYDVHFEQYH